MENFIINEIWARERKNKNKAIAFILKDKWLRNYDIALDRVEALVRDANTLDREWRKVLQDHPHLRGSDYGNKDVLEDKKRVELGYEPKSQASFGNF